MHDFDFLQPDTIAQVSEMLTAHGEACRMIAGGTALLLALRQRMLAPRHLVSLARVRGLRGITFDPTQGLRIGALTRHAELGRSDLVRTHCPMLADIAGRLANPQVRNQGTIGGNICYADPATDPPSCLMALDARLVLASAAASRTLPIEDFLIDYYSTALRSDEVLVAVIIPPHSFNGGLHARFLRTAAEHRPLVNVAVAVRRDGMVCHDARVVVGAATVTPTRVRQAEAALCRSAMTGRLAHDVADIVAEAIAPISDLRGSAEYRRDMARVATSRTLQGLFGLADLERSLA